MWGGVREAGEGPGGASRDLMAVGWVWGLLRPPHEGQTYRGVSEGPVGGRPSPSALASGCVAPWRLWTGMPPAGMAGC